MIYLQKWRGHKVRSTSGKAVERRGEVDWRAATVEWKQLEFHRHADTVETTIGPCKQILSPQTSVVAINVSNEVTQVVMKTRMLSHTSQGHRGIIIVIFCQNM